MILLYELLLTWLFAHVLSLASHPPSPCPDNFKFEGSEPENDKWYGEITLRSNESLVGIRLDIEFDRPTELLTSWMGQVSAHSYMKYTIINLTQRLKKGSSALYRIMIKFNPSGGSPNIRFIRLNGLQICPNELNVQNTQNNGRPNSEFGDKFDQYMVNGENNNSPNKVSLQTDINSLINGVSNEFFPNKNGNNKDVVITIYDGDQQYRPTPINGNQQNRPIMIDYNNQQNRPTAITNNNQQNPPTAIANNNQQNGPTEFVYNNQQNRPTAIANINQQSRPTAFTNNNQQNPPTQFVYNNQQNQPNIANGNQPVFVNNLGQSRPNFNRPTEQLSSNVRPNTNIPGGNILNSTESSQQMSFGFATCGQPKLAIPLLTSSWDTARGQWPWHIALYKIDGRNLTYNCGGSLVSRNKVITAAHCVTNEYDEIIESKKFVIYLGKYYQFHYSGELGIQTKQVLRVNVSPTYNSLRYDGDIAVLTLSSNVEFTKYVSPVCLWDSILNNFDDNIVNEEGTVVGWGYDETNMPTEKLKMGTMPVVSYETCVRSFPEFFSEFTSDYTFCAGSLNGTKACIGDSGGGMVFNRNSRWYLRGIVSITVAKDQQRSCDRSHYVVFTDVSKYQDFVKKNL